MLYDHQISRAKPVDVNMLRNICGIFQIDMVQKGDCARDKYRKTYCNTMDITVMERAEDRTRICMSYVDGKSKWG